MNTENESNREYEDVFSSVVNNNYEKNRHEELDKQVMELVNKSSDKTVLQGTKGKKEMTRREFLKRTLMAMGLCATGAAAYAIGEKLVERDKEDTKENESVRVATSTVEEAYNLFKGNSAFDFNTDNVDTLNNIYNTLNSSGFTDYEIAYIANRNDSIDFLSKIYPGFPTYRDMLEKYLTEDPKRGTINYEVSGSEKELQIRNYLKLYSLGFANHVDNYVNAKTKTSVSDIEASYQLLASNLDVAFSETTDTSKISNPMDIENMFKNANFKDFEIAYVAHRQGNDYFHKLINEKSPSYIDLVNMLMEDNNIDKNDKEKMQTCIEDTLRSAGFTNHVNTYIANLTDGMGRGM